ncbi:hypothetical protein ABIA85_006561 [Bradyrhizobium sp. LA6.10]|uniref:CHAT domain-containing protein n=1 Tax=Bradyrhizobium sp. LA6.10 TaxID=3156318 RepID=UPI00339A9EC8
MPLDDRIFEIRVTSGSEPGSCHISAGCPGETERSHEDVKLPPFSDWNTKLLKLQEALLLEPLNRTFEQMPVAKGSKFTKDRASPLVLEEIGQSLFDLIFVRNIFAGFAKNFEKANRDHINLRIRLAIEAAELSALPWETLYNASERRYLAPSPKTPIVRGSSDDADFWSPAELPLSILGLVPEARGFGSLNVEAEKANIRNALESALDPKDFNLGWINPGNASELVDRLDEPPPGSSSWHVLHFIGHGGYDDEMEAGYIVVDPDIRPSGVPASSGSAEKLYADDLRSALDTANGLRLVILNSCKGAATSPGTLFSSTAERLILQGFPAVVAMQFEISDEAAIAFSAELYKQLARGSQIPDAVTRARMTLKRMQSPEWITPVLYMRTREGRLFREISAA